MEKAGKRKAAPDCAAADVAHKSAKLDQSLKRILREVFGHSEFRGKQLEAVSLAMSGKDCFVLMPTGALTD